MTSSYLDEFVLNFDLNHLAAEENIQTPDQKYERLRKSTSWLKSKIISTDFMIQKYQTKKDDYEQSVKAHSVTREELKQACINYKDASEKCSVLENENKMLLANQEVYKKRVTDVENKYDALISHTNQLQVLVKQLENEKDALVVEKELDKYNNKDANKEITALQKEKDAILNDLMALKDVVLGEKKTSKRHLKVLKKYVKDVKCKASRILCTSEESEDEMGNSENNLSHTQKSLNEVRNVTGKDLLSSAEQNFIDTYSDGDVSVDTGRGSSRANSHDKCLSSPDYTLALETALNTHPKDVIKRIDVASSPITVYPLRAVATSPIIFDDPSPLPEDQYDDYTDCLAGEEYVIDEVPISEEINDLVEQEKLADCVSPVPDLSKFIDTETDCIENYEVIIVKEAANSCSEESLFIESGANEFDQDMNIEKQIPRCLCEKSDILTINDKKNFIDTCTSPLPLSPDPRNFVDIGINTDENYEGANIVKNIDFKMQRSKTCEKSTNTVFLSQTKRYVNACTSPIVQSCDTSECVYLGTNIGNQKSHITDEEELPVIDEQISKGSNKKSFSKFSDNTIPNPTEKLRTQEKVCLESNSSKNLHYENANDAEVQNILNVMKLHNDLISPISKTPCDSQYLKLIPEMNYTLTKIWTTIANMYRMPNRLRNNDPDLPNSTEIDELRESSEGGTNTNKKNCDPQPPAVARTSNQDVDDDMLETNRPCVETSSISIDSPCSELSNIISNENLKRKKSDVCANKLSPHCRTDKLFVAIEEDVRRPTNPQQQYIENSSDKVNSEDNVSNTKLTEIDKMSKQKDNKKEIRDCEQQCIANASELNEIYPDNINNITSTNNNESCNTTEVPKGHTIMINATKTKKKSKLEKFRAKLLPSCKIKKVAPSIIKHPSKVCIKPTDTMASISLNQKIAYEKAVKVMTEFRSNQKLQNKSNLLSSAIGDTNIESKSCEIESTHEIFEQKKISTRSRTRTWSKKEEDTSVSTNFEQIIKAIERSPINRKLRKRPADTEIDSLQCSNKRVLRSSNISQVFNENVLPVLRNDNNVADQLNKDFKKNCDSQGRIRNVSSPGTLRGHCEFMADDPRVSLNLRNRKCSSTQDEHAADSGITFEKGIKKRMKPVIELSEKLADGANLESIIPSNVGYLDVNKNINHSKTSETESNNSLDAQNNGTKHEITSTSQVEANDVFIKTTKRNSTNINEYPNVDKTDIRSEHVAEQITPSRKNEQILYEKHSDITNTERNISKSLDFKLREETTKGMKNPVVHLIPLKNDIVCREKKTICYSDLDLYTMESNTEQVVPNTPLKPSQRRKENILCGALDRYGVISVKYTAKKVPETVTLKVCQIIEEGIAKIIASSKSEQKTKMDDLVSCIQNFKTKHILAGFMKYLKDPMRKNELFNKIINGAAPPMTKSEVILLYVIERLNASSHLGFIKRLWNNMEHALFQLNHAPDFDVIESMSHFYAVLCRYFRNKSRLRCFMLDAMYCLQFKAVPLIRQCLDVCPGVLPNAHERMAKTSLVTCLVYLLHFYKCKDKYNRAQDIRNILQRKYQYRFSEWNETMILEIFRKAIMDLRGTHNDKKMLRVALIILCKRHGAKWCQLNIIQNILLPIIEKKDVPERIKQFCVLMLGPLLKPFPADRKAQCEIVINQLLQMMKQNTSQEMKEAIYSSLIFMNKHDQERVVQALLSWDPETVSSDFEEILNDYVMEKPLAVWKKLVAKKPSHYS